jgi:hypothetical protein
MVWKKNSVAFRPVKNEFMTKPFAAGPFSCNAPARAAPVAAAGGRHARARTTHLVLKHRQRSIKESLLNAGAVHLVNHGTRAATTPSRHKHSRMQGAHGTTAKRSTRDAQRLCRTYGLLADTRHHLTNVQR